MAWYDGELYPASKKGWERAPEGAKARGEDCEHENGVVAPQRGVNREGGPATTRGMIFLHCMHCDSDWQEPMSNIKGSPFEGK